MPVQFPSLSIDQQTQRYQDMATNTGFPYSYPFIVANTQNTGIFPNDAGDGFSYFSMGFQADNNLAITAIQFQTYITITQDSGTFSPQFLFSISYSPILRAFPIGISTTLPSVPTVPGDTGNEIFRQYLTEQSSATLETFLTANIYERFHPNPYILKYNQILYIHVAVDSNAITIGCNITSNLIFHTTPTGLKI